MYNISVRRGDTLNAVNFELLQYTDVATLPATGITGIIYRVDGVKYKWNGTTFVTTTDKNPVNLAGATIRMEIKKTEFDKPVQILTESDGLTITDGANGMFDINSQIFTIPIDVYQYEIIVTLATGVVKTYVDGTMEVY